jgi:hypothetical protein
MNLAGDGDAFGPYTCPPSCGVDNHDRSICVYPTYRRTKSKACRQHNKEGEYFSIK